MQKYEYKSIELQITKGLLTKKTLDLSAPLNAEGRNGWRLVQLVASHSMIATGTQDSVVAVFERPVS